MGEPGRPQPGILEAFLPRVQKVFGDSVKDVTEDQWVFANNDVRPSLIRTESDETTYNLHVMLRFELEQAMLTDQIKAMTCRGYGTKG